LADLGEFVAEAFDLFRSDFRHIVIGLGFLWLPVGATVDKLSHGEKSDIGLGTVVLSK
jgi:hypothetical protein